jgi:hypothetical protein
MDGDLGQEACGNGKSWTRMRYRIRGVKGAAKGEGAKKM